MFVGIFVSIRHLVDPSMFVSKAHKTALTLNRPTFVNNLILTEGLYSELLAEIVITAEMESQIRVNKLPSF